MDGCPSTSSDVKISSDKLNCTSSLVYHCLRDQAGLLTEKCIKPSWIQKGHCAEYNTVAQRLDAKPCTPTRGICPDKPYLSNNVLSFSGCTPTEREPSKITTAISADNHTESNGIEVFVVVIPIILSIVLVCILVGVAVFICYYRRKQGNNGSDVENTELLNRDHGNESEEKRKESEEKRKEEHLKKEEGSLKFFEYKGTCTKYLLKTATEHLQNNENVIIVGKPGSGKTTLAWTVCKQMHGESSNGKKWYVTVSADTDDIPDENDMILLLLDGRFESAWTTERTVEKIMEGVKKEFGKKFPTKQVRIMVTISQLAYRRIEKYDCIQTLKPWHIIDLDDKKNSLNIVEMSKVFETNDIFIQNVKEASDYNVLSNDELRSMYECFLPKVFSSIPKLGLPLIATMMALNLTFLGNIDFVKEPIKCVLESIEQLRMSGKKDDNNKYCTIVYAAFKGGYVNINDDKEMMMKIGNYHKIQEPDFDTNFYLLQKRPDGIWEFVHESLMHVFLTDYGKKHLGFVTRHCPLGVLLEYSLSGRGGKRDGEAHFYLEIVGTVNEENLIKRMIPKDIDIQHHRMWEKKKFQKVYKKIYTTKDK